MIAMQGRQKSRRRIRLGLCPGLRHGLRHGLGFGLGLAATLATGCGPKYFQVPVQVTGKSGEAITSAYLTPVPESWQGKERDYPMSYQVNEAGLAVVDSLLKRDPIRLRLNFAGGQSLYVSDTLEIDPSRKYTATQPFRVEADSVARVTLQKTEIRKEGEVMKDKKTQINRSR